MSTKNQGAIIDSDWLAGVVAAARYAHENYMDAIADDIIDAAIAVKVREDAGIPA